jgi:hypothetical protein
MRTAVKCKKNHIYFVIVDVLFYILSSFVFSGPFKEQTDIKFLFVSGGI